MTAQEIARRLVETPKGITPIRVKKAQALAQASKVDWSQVLACLTDAQRAQVA